MPYFGMRDEPRRFLNSTDLLALELLVVLLGDLVINQGIGQNGERELRRATPAVPKLQIR